jgi:hypothetical protein
MGFWVNTALMRKPISSKGKAQLLRALQVGRIFIPCRAPRNSRIFDTLNSWDGNLKRDVYPLSSRRSHDSTIHVTRHSRP